MTIELEFQRIDWWGCPVYKVIDKNVYMGSVNTIFPDESIAPNNTVAEINAYFRDNLDELVIFGSTFDEGHDPLGSPIRKDITIIIKDN